MAQYRANNSYLRLPVKHLSLRVLFISLNLIQITTVFVATTADKHRRQRLNVGYNSQQRVKLGLKIEAASSTQRLMIVFRGFIAQMIHT